MRINVVFRRKRRLNQKPLPPQCGSLSISSGHCMRTRVSTYLRYSRPGHLTFFGDLPLLCDLTVAFCFATGKPLLKHFTRLFQPATHIWAACPFPSNSSCFSSMVCSLAAVFSERPDVSSCVDSASSSSLAFFCVHQDFSQHRLCSPKLTPETRSNTNICKSCSLRTLSAIRQNETFKNCRKIRRSRDQLNEIYEFLTHREVISSVFDI